MLHQQAWSFMIALIAGMTAGFIFDVYRVIRRLFGLRRIGTAVGDVITWVIVSLSAFILLLIGNWAEMRLYILLALAAGLTGYLTFLSSFCQKGILYFFRTLAWVITTTVKISLLPCRLILRQVVLLFVGLKWFYLLVLRIMEYLLSFPQGFAYGLYLRLTRNSQPPHS